MFDITEELKKLPDQPGVYIMHDEHDAIIYIGKAVSLRKRVHQYFQPSHDEGIKKAQMVRQIARFEYIVTDSELEALVLECKLIKEHRPRIFRESSFHVSRRRTNRAISGRTRAPGRSRTP